MKVQFCFKVLYTAIKAKLMTIGQLACLLTVQYYYFFIFIIKLDTKFNTFFNFYFNFFLFCYLIGGGMRGISYLIYYLK